MEAAGDGLSTFPAMLVQDVAPAPQGLDVAPEVPKLALPYLPPILEAPRQARFERLPTGSLPACRTIQPVSDRLEARRHHAPGVTPPLGFFMKAPDPRVAVRSHPGQSFARDLHHLEPLGQEQDGPCR